MGLHWSQLPQGFAERQGERACAGTRLPPRPSVEALGVGKWWWTVWSSSTGPNWQWTPLWSQHSAQTGPFLGREQQWVENLRRARARKERTCQIGGPCWSNETSSLCVLWHGPKRGVPESTQTQVAHAWNRRWRKFLACTAAKVVREDVAGAHGQPCRWHNTNTLRG